MSKSLRWLHSSFLLARALGDEYTRRYSKLREYERKGWEQRRIMHHGAFGLYLASFSARRLSAIFPQLSRMLVGAGVGLMVSDWHDRRVWFSRGGSRL